jgi:glycosyltransferase involved in cell wall biosynthesis
MSISGVIWIGPLLDRGGYGNVSRNFVKGLHRVGFPVRTFSVGVEHAEVDPDDARLVRDLAGAEVGGRAAAVVNLEPEMLRGLRIEGVAQQVCCSIFETDRIPAHWPECFEPFDEVWVPSEFNLRTYGASGVPPGKLVKIPYGIDTQAFAPRVQATGEGRPFRFLYCFAFGWRKGFDLLLRAYREEFTADDDVELVLKVFAAGGVEQDALRDTFLAIFREDPERDPATLPALLVIDDPVSQAELQDLYASADVYFSTDRANGWGMPALECMAMGVPCATIDWSGSTEFMRAGDAVLIPAQDELVPVDERLAAFRPDLYTGHRWPDVRPESVRAALRWSFENRGGGLRAVGESGRRTILSEFSIEAAARRLVEHLGRVEPDEGLPALTPRVSTRSPHPLWRRALNALLRPDLVLRRLSGR